MSSCRKMVVAVTALRLLAGCADAPRLVTQDPASGFALYRSGRLSPADLEVLCRLGVEEILVLDGQGADRECLFQQTLCPGLRIRYDFAQEEDRPVSLDFLQAFDAWIEDARANGTKVAIRCRHGWHRTGRLAAYYRIRFEGYSADDAIREMQDIGRMMWRHPTLDPQVEAYEDVVAGRPCSTDPANCPLNEPDGGLLDGLFPENACGDGWTTETSRQRDSEDQS